VENKRRKYEGWGGWSDIFFLYYPNSYTTIDISKTDSTGIAVSGRFKWNKIKNIATYHLQLSKSNEFFDNIIDKTDIQDTSQLFNYLDNNTKYYWRVRAKTKSGIFGLWSVVSNFTTEAPLDVPILIAPKKLFVKCI